MSQRPDPAARRRIDPNKIHVGDLVLVKSRNAITIWVQRRLGYGSRSEWTHVAGSIGGYDLVEGQVPRARVADLQKDYVEKGFEIKVLRRTWAYDPDRVKVALWWATMNNLGYDFLQLAWFAVACVVRVRQVILASRNQFDEIGKKICSELITEGFYKQGYNLFDKPAANVLPADFDDPALFEHVTDIWLAPAEP